MITVLLGFFTGNCKRGTANHVLWSTTVHHNGVRYKSIKVLCSVWEKMKERLEETFTLIGGLKSRMLSWGRTIGIEGNKNLLNG